MVTVRSLAPSVTNVGVSEPESEGRGEREKDGDSFDFRQISEQFRLNLDLTDILRGFWGLKMIQMLF